MIKLTHMIVDNSYRLLGFIAKGSVKDFGELGTGSISKPISLKWMFNSNFANKQIATKRGTILEKPGFKLNNLPMMMLTEVDKSPSYVPIDNTITLTKRYVQDNENVGFDFVIGKDNTGKNTTENIIKLCDIFNPTNFVIRSGKDNKKFIAGKAGSSLSTLPSEILGTPIEAKRTRPAAKKTENITGDYVSDADILDLYDFIREVNGFIINLPGTKYTATTESAAAREDFVPFDIGEVGTPYLDFNESKMNVSCNFKKPGAIAMKMSSGKVTNIITFVYRRKNIFFNGENYIKKLGVVVPVDAEGQLIEKFGRTMSFTEITDPGMTRPISMLIAQQNVKFYEVDTSKIAIISRKKYGTFILSSEDILNKVTNLTMNKLILKYLNGLRKDIQKQVGSIPGTEKIKDIAPQFAGMSHDDLVILSDYGIDIYSGAFTMKDEGRKTSGVSSDDSVDITYAVDGLNVSSLTYNQIAAGDKKVPDFLANIVARFGSITDLEDKMAKATALADKLTKENEAYKRDLWTHKCAMYLMYHKAAVHVHDAKDWELNTKKRTKATCYNCKKPGCEKLQLLVTNIDIK